MVDQTIWTPTTSRSLWIQSHDEHVDIRGDLLLSPGYLLLHILVWRGVKVVKRLNFDDSYQMHYPLFHLPNLM